jgi:hypothetical protein
MALLACTIENKFFLPRFRLATTSALALLMREKVTTLIVIGLQSHLDSFTSRLFWRDRLSQKLRNLPRCETDSYLEASAECFKRPSITSKR